MPSGLVDSSALVCVGSYVTNIVLLVSYNCLDVYLYTVAACFLS